MTKLRKVLTLGICLLWIHQTQAQFTLSGEFRPRAEYRRGYKTLAAENQDPAFFVEQRTRVNMNLVQEEYEFKVVFQDIRVWGSQSQLVKNDGALTTLHEAWGAVKMGENSRFKIGRQEIILDDHRMFGNVGWAQQARSHDALIFETNTEKFSMKLAGAYNQEVAQINTSFYTVPNSYKTLQFAWIKQKFDSFNASVLVLNNGKQGGVLGDSRTYFGQTIGTRFDFMKGALRPGGNIYVQRGKDADGTKINALEYSLELNYSITEKTKLTAGMEYLSGNSEVSNSGENQAFNPLYGTNHKFNGFMDYFYVGNHAKSVGLQDVFVKVKTKIGKVGSQADVHFFSSAADILDPETSAAANSYLGTEVDLVINYQSSADVNLKVGYSQMFGTDSMELLKGGDSSVTNNWGWVMLTIKPTFFTSAKG